MDNVDDILEDAAHQEAIGNFRRAAELFTIAKDAGRTDAAIRLSHLYADGNGVDRDPAMAAQLLEWAIDLGDANAAFNYAAMLHSGNFGLAQDRARAQHFFRLAKKLGYNSIALEPWLDDSMDP